jgi:hypothetical protein
MRDWGSKRKGEKNPSCKKRKRDRYKEVFFLFLPSLSDEDAKMKWSPKGRKKEMIAAAAVLAV